MNNSGDSLDFKLHDADELLKAGRKVEARQVLREALAMDRNNLATWELLWQAANNIEEELLCLKHILAINPKHSEARQRYEALRPTSAAMSKSANQPSSTGRLAGASKRPSSQKKKKEQSAILLLFLGSLIAVMCASITGFALYQGGYIPLGAPFARTATALAQNSASCQALIDKAISASGNYCDNTSSNNVCYGNTTIKAELAPDANQQFSERGDMIAVDKLQRLTAYPLNIDTD